MEEFQSLDTETDFDYVLSFLPAGWEGKARELGALRRCRKFPDARMLLRILLIHLAEGCSLRETVVRAREGGLLDVSDVAVMERLRQSEAWFRWMNGELVANWVAPSHRVAAGGRWNIQVVDGSQVSEPGPTGSSWRIHYSLRLPSLQCAFMEVTDSCGKGNGENLRRFPVRPGDLFLGDRAYGLSPGIGHVVRAGGDVLVRFGWNNLPLWSAPEKRFDLFQHLRKLRGTQCGDWPVHVRDRRHVAQGRVCAVKKSRPAIEEAQRAVRRKAQKHGAEVLEETLEAAAYIFVFTTVPAGQLSPLRALEFYRGRWQVELAFKRMKSLLGLGHLPKTDEASARAWLQGKLFVAILLEVLLRHGESFFPWGYPLRPL